MEEVHISDIGGEFSELIKLSRYEPQRVITRDNHSAVLVNPAYFEMLKHLEEINSNRNG